MAFSIRSDGIVTLLDVIARLLELPTDGFVKHFGFSTLTFKRGYKAKHIIFEIKNSYMSSSNNQQRSCHDNQLQITSTVDCFIAHRTSPSFLALKTAILPLKTAFFKTIA